MITRGRFALLAGTALAVASLLTPPAAAQENLNPLTWFGVSGGYFRVDTGYSWSRKLTGGENGLGGAFGDTAGRSYIGQVGFGGFVDPFRIDITGAYRGSYAYDAGGRGRVGPLAAPTVARAKVDNYTVMANVYFDIPTEAVPNVITGTGLRPYIGAGIGWSRNIIGTRYIFNAQGSGFERGARNSDLAWSLMAGVAVYVTRNIQLDIGYRYIDFGKLRTSGQTTFGTFAPSEANFRAHEAMIGLRFSFAEPVAAVKSQTQTSTTTTSVTQTPPPAPAPAPAPAQAPSYLVFFDFDRAVITEEAAGVIRQAAAAVQNGEEVRLVVTGHADRAGSADYNLRLSQRRAEAVQQALQRAGIAGNQIVTRGRGEEDPRVETADGVREPQNRRAEIVIE